MSRLDDRKHEYMQRMLGFTVMFAILGCIVLFFAINYVSNVITGALK